MNIVRRIWRLSLWVSALLSLLLAIAAAIFWMRGFWFYDTVGLRMSGSTLALYSAGRFGVRYDVYDPASPWPPGTSRWAYLSFPVSASPLNPGHSAFSYHQQVIPPRLGAPRHSIPQYEMFSELLILLATIWPAIFLPVAFWRRRRKGPQGSFPVELKAS